MKTGLFIIDPAYRASELTGHYSHYDEAIAQAASKNAVSYHIVGQATLSPPSSQLNNIFEYDIWGNPVNSGLLIDSLGIQDCHGYFYTKTRDYLLSNYLNTKEDWIFIPNATPFTIMGVLKAATEVISENAIIVMFRYGSDLFKYNLKDSEIDFLRNFLLSANVWPVCDSELLSEEYSRFFQVDKFETLNIPVDEEFKHIRPKFIDGPFFFDTFGNARGEKGTVLILQAAQMMKEFCLARDIRFRIQCNDPSQDVIESLQNFDLIQNPHVEMISQAQSDQDYRQRLSESKCVLLPYDPSIYGARTSGILLEALVSGVPSIVTNGTWLEAKSREFLTLNFCNFSVEGLIAAIETIYWNYEKCQFSSLYARLSAFNENNNISVFKQLESIRKRSAAKRVLVFYPWGENTVNSTGAGFRLTMVCEQLRKNNIEFKVISLNYFALADEKVGRKGEWIDFPFKLYKSKNLHIGIHKGSFPNHVQLELLALIAESDYFIFLSTHTVLPVLQLCNDLDSSKIVIESFDLLSSKNIEEKFELLELQKRALKLGSAFGLSKEESAIFSDRELKVTYSNLSLSRRESKHLELCDFIFGKLLEKIPNLKNGFVLFVGSNYSPNEVTASFIEKAGAHLDGNEDPMVVIVGNVRQKYENRNVISLGYVDSLVLETLYRNCNFLINPMFEGTGVPIKVISAFQYGAKVFATTLGARNIEPSNSIIIQDFEITKHKEYAEAIRKLNASNFSNQYDFDKGQISSSEDDEFIKFISNLMEIKSIRDSETNIEEILEVLICFQATLSEVALIFEKSGVISMGTIRESILLSFLFYSNSKFTLDCLIDVISGDSVREIMSKYGSSTWKNSRIFLEPQIKDDIRKNGLDLLEKFSEDMKEHFTEFLGVILKSDPGLLELHNWTTYDKHQQKDIYTLRLSDFIIGVLRHRLIFAKYETSSFRNRRQMLLRSTVIRRILRIRMKPAKFWAKLLKIVVGK